MSKSAKIYYFLYTVVIFLVAMLMVNYALLMESRASEKEIKNYNLFVKALHQENLSWWLEDENTCERITDISSLIAKGNFYIDNYTVRRNKNTVTLKIHNPYSLKAHHIFFHHPFTTELNTRIKNHDYDTLISRHMEEYSHYAYIACEQRNTFFREVFIGWLVVTIVYAFIYQRHINTQAEKRNHARW